MMNLTVSAAAAETPDTLFVCLMGIGVVFVGLICIVFITLAMGGAVRMFEKKKTAVAMPVSQEPAPIENRGEFVAAVSTAIAEQLGTDVNAIRIKSIKKV